MSRQAFPVPEPRLWHADYCLARGLRSAAATFAAGTPTGAVVVDFGCGTSPYKALFPAGTKYVGVDVVASPYADIVIDPGQRVPFDDGGADAVISTQVLHKVEAFGDYLAEAARMLKPGGRLFLTTHGTWTYHPATGGDFIRFTHDGLRRAVERAGFDVRGVDPLVGTLGTGLHLRQLVFNAWLRRLGLRPVAAALNVVTNLWILANEAVTPAGSRLAAPVALALVAVRR